MTVARKDLGKRGEETARKHLQRNGYKILARNYSCPVGEIDLIGYKDGCIVFVEVKTRAEDAAGDPEENITPGKRRRLERAAQAWLAFHGQPECAYRFDAVSVILPADGEPRVRHIVEAFVPAR